MRNIFVCCLVLTLLVVNANAFNATWGQMFPRDTLAHREFVVLRGQPNRVISANVTFPKKGYVNYRRISFVRALDLDRYNKGGFPVLSKGGPGYNNATILLKSRQSGNLNYTVEIYVQ